MKQNEIKDASTSELRVLQERIKMELANRVDEVEIPVLKVVTNDESYYLDIGSFPNVMSLIEVDMIDALKNKSRIFNISSVMLPESTYKQWKQEGVFDS